MSYYDSVTNTQKTHEINIEPHVASLIHSNDITKLAASQMIKDLERSLLDRENPDIYMAKKMDSDKLILDLSL